MLDDSLVFCLVNETPSPEFHPIRVPKCESASLAQLNLMESEVESLIITR